MKKKKAFRPGLVIGLAAFTIVVLAFHAPLQRMIFEHAALANTAPAPEVIAEAIEHAANPHATLFDVWHSGKIVDREVAVREVRSLSDPSQPIQHDFEPLLFAAALDPDANVRETALSILREHKHAALPALAAEQLHDPDRDLQQLGLDCLKQVAPAVGIPAAAALLNDHDPAVLGASIKLLEQLSGEKFGVKLADTMEVGNETNGLLEFQTGATERIEASAVKARAWWAAHQSEFPPAKLQLPTPDSAFNQPLSAPDFELRDLDGKKVRLSDYRGKVVLINFWTTWCTSCVGEIPELVALRKKHGDDLVILGVSLDFTPDEDGDASDIPAVEDQGKRNSSSDGRPAAAGSPQQIRQKITRVVKARDINYPVLLDEHFEAGGLYNGGELPTTVIVDAQGNIRRRFLGARSLPVFEAMIAQAGQPLTLTAKSAKNAE